MRNRFQFARRTAAAVVGVAALTAAGALQASAAPVPTRITGSPVAHGHGHAHPVPAAPSISISADRTTVRAWHKVTFTGTTTGIADNTTVTVQGLQRGRWVNYPATTTTSSASYSVSVESGRIGVDTFRVATPKTDSDSVTVTVIK